MENEPENAPSPSHTQVIENGIFNLVVSYCQQLGQTPRARDHVADYLQRLADGLRSFPPPDGQTNEPEQR